MKKWVKMGAVSVLCLALSACASSSDDADVNDATGNAKSYGLGSDDMNADGSDLYSESKSDPNLTVYFEFNQDSIQPDYEKVIVRNADYLVAHPHAQARIEGHADEVGSREYNIALGERRADAVKKALVARGVASSQLSTVSYGMEYPVPECANLKQQRCALNRRAVIVFTNKG